MRILILVILALLILAVPICFAQSPPPSHRITLYDVLGWLPPDTETVIGANGPFSWESPENVLKPTREQSLSPVFFKAQTRWFPLFLANFKNGGLGEFIKGRSVTLAIEGSRRYSVPAGLGVMPYEGCLILVFAPGVALDENKFMSDNAKAAQRSMQIGSVRVAAFNEQSEEDVWTTFVAFPRANVALVATNLAYLRTLLGRMGNASGARALPRDLTEWKYVDTDAPVWGVRHFRQDVNHDPSSPLLGEESAGIRDKGARGITFSFSSPALHTVTIHYFSASADAPRILADFLNPPGNPMAKDEPEESWRVPTRQVSPGVVEVSYVLARRMMVQMLVGVLMAAFGHAVAV